MAKYDARIMAKYDARVVFGLDFIAYYLPSSIIIFNHSIMLFKVQFSCTRARSREYFFFLRSLCSKFDARVVFGLNSLGIIFFLQACYSKFSSAVRERVHVQAP